MGAGNTAVYIFLSPLIPDEFPSQIHVNKENVFLRSYFNHKIFISWWLRGILAQLNNFVSVMLFRFKCIIFPTKSGCKSLFVAGREDGEKKVTLGTIKWAQDNIIPGLGSKHWRRIPNISSNMEPCNILLADTFLLSVVMLSWLWWISEYTSSIWWHSCGDHCIILSTDNSNTLVSCSQYGSHSGGCDQHPLPSPPTDPL